MIEISVIFGLYVLGSLILILYVLRQGREERRELEDRVMALSKPEALIAHKALTDPEPARVEAVDEELEGLAAFAAAENDGSVHYED